MVSRKSIILWAAMVFLMGVPCLAQADQCQVERNAGTHALNEVSWNQLNAINEDIGQERYEEAHEDLQKMLGRAGRDEYLQAILNNALAQLEWTRKNYDASLSHFEAAVALDVLPDTTHFGLIYQMAQLYFMNDQFGEALEKLDLWFCKAPGQEVSSAAYVLKAAIMTSMENYPGALEAITQAIVMDAEPREQWYQLKLAAQFELQQLPEAAETLEIMIARWPADKNYWLQLTQVRMELNQDDRALAILALAYRNGLLDAGSDISYLSSLYSNSDLPYKAAEVLQNGIRDEIVPADQKTWTLVADSWYAAEELELALTAYEEAGKMSDDGSIDLRRAYLLVDLERWPAALEALDRVLKKGGLNERKTGEAYLLRGMTWFNLDEFDKAGADWGRARGHETTREAAQQWINHLREERLRRAS